MNFRFVCAAALLAAVSPAWAVGSAAGAVPVATRAIQLVDRGDFDAARATLRQAFAGRPDAPLHFAQLEGLILVKEGQVRAAIDVFRFILSREPNFTPARIELSRALASLGESDAALHQLQLIELGSNDPEVRRQARSFGESVKSQRPYGFSGYVSFLPSTNVNKGSGRKTFTVGGLEFQIDDDSRGQSGWGIGGGGDAYRTFYLDETTRLTWSGALDVKKYSQGSSYDELAVSTNLSIAKRLGRVEFRIGPTIDYRLVSWRPYAFRYGIAVGASVDMAAHTQFYSGATFLKQDFADASYRDGQIFLGYAGFRHAFSPSLAASITANVSAERTKRDYLDHNDIKLTAQIDREWTGGIITSFAVGAGYHDYLGDFPGTWIRRRDDIWSAGVTAMNRNWSFQGFSPQIKYEYTRQKSNISFYDYDSHDIDLTLTKLF